MNFFRAQEQARKQSFVLLALFGGAVVFLVSLTLLIVAGFVWHSDPSLIARSAGEPLEQGLTLQGLWWAMQSLGWKRILAIVILVAGTIGMGVVFKWLTLRTGGYVVAEAMGGKPLAINDADFKSQRLRNVVEEMALAAGMAVPPVYVLPNERGINAFAAGLGQEDAIIAVSQGCLDSLNREQLQGVVAHEISHILNGDMRLNVQMVVVLHGIRMISDAGRVLMDVGRHHRGMRGRDKGNALAALFVTGLALFVLGWLGQALGQAIRFAVSRQREYLADASAVQFTRNPHGIGGALRVIAGHAAHGRVHHRAASEYGHLFFANVFSDSWFASHPPIEQRIRRILPGWDGSFLRVQALSEEELAYMERSRSTGLEAQVSSLAPIEYEPVKLTKAPQSDQIASALVGSASSFQGVPESKVSPKVLRLECSICVTQFALQINPQLREFVDDPLGAVGLILALLLDEHDGVREQQQQILHAHAASWMPTVSVASELCRAQQPEAQLALLELAMPAFKQLSHKQYQRLRQVMVQLIQVDQQISPSEWAKYEWVRQHGDRHHGLSRPFKPKFRKLHQVQDAFNLVLSRVLMCQTGEASAQRSLRHQQALAVAGIEELSLVDGAELQPAAYIRAVHRLRYCFPLLKPRLMKALIFAARADAEVNVEEQQLIATIALIWDCPLVGLEDSFQ